MKSNKEVFILVLVFFLSFFNCIFSTQTKTLTIEDLLVNANTSLMNHGLDGELFNLIKSSGGDSGLEKDVRDNIDSIPIIEAPEKSKKDLNKKFLKTKDSQNKNNLLFGSSNFPESFSFLENSLKKETESKDVDNLKSVFETLTATGNLKIDNELSKEINKHENLVNTPTQQKVVKKPVLKENKAYKQKRRSSNTLVKTNKNWLSKKGKLLNTNNKKGLSKSEIIRLGEEVVQNRSDDKRIIELLDILH